jgi:outer membrane lipoprotein SlyB
MTAKTPLKTFAVAVAASAALAGCASGLGAGDYGRGSVGTVNRVEEGTIVAVRPIRIEGRETPAVGTVTGAVLGGAAGSEIGGGDKARAAGAVAGAVAGGIIGGAVERGVTSGRGFAYTVRKTDGQLITITQGADIAMNVGQPVFIEYGARARVIPRG